eukprot:scaffold29716_cov61-Phaeocystis_antarctica.AAC.5
MCGAYPYVHVHVWSSSDDCVPRCRYTTGISRSVTSETRERSQKQVRLSPHNTLSCERQVVSGP